MSERQETITLAVPTKRCDLELTSVRRHRCDINCADTLSRKQLWAQSLCTKLPEVFHNNAQVNFWWDWWLRLAASTSKPTNMATDLPWLWPALMRFSLKLWSWVQLILFKGFLGHLEMFPYCMQVTSLFLFHTGSSQNCSEPYICLRCLLKTH